MDWRGANFDWNRARAFLATVEEGSLSAAARALGQTQPTLGRQIASLEQELGVALFERAGRGMTPTPTGRDLATHVRAMRDAAYNLSLAASGRSEAVEGVVRVSCSEAAAYFALPQMLAELRRKAPGVQVELAMENAISNLREREADIAIRSVRPEDPELYARRLPDGGARLYATPGYLAEQGPFDDPEALAKAEFIGLDDNMAWREGLRAAGVPVTDANFPLRTTHFLVLWALTAAGAGIGVMAKDFAESDPRVVRAAPWMPDFPFETWLVAHRELMTSRRIRLVFDHLAEGLEAVARRSRIGV